MNAPTELAKNTGFFKDFVELTPHYQKSIRIDRDLDRSDVLSSFILHETGKRTLSDFSSLIAEGHCAFTWTGPYGGGKSSLAAYLAALTSENSRLKDIAESMLGEDTNSETIRKVFLDGQPWRLIPVVGDRKPFIELCFDALDKVRKRRGRKNTHSIDGLVSQIEWLSGISGERIILVVDELGKVLESAVSNSFDIYCFQNLAEHFSRSKCRPIFVGVLHQSFERYAKNLDDTARGEWAKIQGRFDDQPFLTSTDESLGLVSKAISFSEYSEESKRAATDVFSSLKKQKANLDPDLEKVLAECWPLHPCTAVLLTSLTRKAFSQGQRSLFGFLSAPEPYGFRSWIEHTLFSAQNSYLPSDLFDFIRANLDQTLSVSSDRHRWALAIDGLHRTEAKFTEAHVRLFKCIALLDLFRDVSGLLASEDILASFGICEKDDLRALLRDLEGHSAIIYRRHLAAYALYAGSDFDLEKAVRSEEGKISLGVDELATHVELLPLVAKRHCFDTGTLRWFGRQLVLDENVHELGEPNLHDGSIGIFYIVIGESIQSLRKSYKRFKDSSSSGKSQSSGQISRNIFCWPKSEEGQKLAVSVASNCKEISVLKSLLRSRPELDGDSVARKEIRGLLDALQAKLFSELESYTASLDCFYLSDTGEPKLLSGATSLSSYASDVAKLIFPCTPDLRSELLNREVVSSSAMKACKSLMYQMLANERFESLGFQNWPPERGLYQTLLAATGLHVKITGSDVYRFVCSSETSSALGMLWRATDEKLDADKPVNVEELYELWSAPPFGIRKGVRPILIWTYLLARREEVVFYFDKVFQTELLEINADELLRRPQVFSLRRLSINEGERETLSLLAREFSKYRGSLIDESPLSVAKAVVHEFMRLPRWSRRTSVGVSKEVAQIRAKVLTAADPNKLLFVQLPELFDSRDSKTIVRGLIDSLESLNRALPTMVNTMWDDFLGWVNEPEGSVDSLKRRARAIQEDADTVDTKLVLTHLVEFNGSLAAKFSLICSLVRKTDREFADHDIESARSSLKQAALEIRKLELLSHLSSDRKDRVAVSIGFGLKGGDSVVKFLDVDQATLESAKNIEQVLIKTTRGFERSALLVALANLSKSLVKEEN
jgi:energy-coupling factor transporter ATP-binding protein EcfA2